MGSRYSTLVVYNNSLLWSWSVGQVFGQNSVEWPFWYGTNWACLVWTRGPRKGFTHLLRASAGTWAGNLVSGWFVLYPWSLRSYLHNISGSSQTSYMITQDSKNQKAKRPGSRNCQSLGLEISTSLLLSHVIDQTDFSHPDWTIFVRLSRKQWPDLVYHIAGLNL